MNKFAKMVLGAIMLAGVGTVATTAVSTPAQAQVSVGIGFGPAYGGYYGGYYGPRYYGGYYGPRYYGPRYYNYGPRYYRSGYYRPYRYGYYNRPYYSRPYYRGYRRWYVPADVKRNGSGFPGPFFLVLFMIPLRFQLPLGCSGSRPRTCLVR